MAETTNIDSLQAQLASQHEEAVRTQALQQVLQAFAPGTLQNPVGYRVLLHRVHTLLTEALGSTPPPAEAPETEALPPPETPPPQDQSEDKTDDV